jgi:hypothetical protein
MGRVEVWLQVFLTSTVGVGEWSFTPRKELAVTVEKETGSPPQYRSGLFGEGKFCDPAGTRTPDRVSTTPPPSPTFVLFRHIIIPLFLLAVKVLR